MLRNILLASAVAFGLVHGQNICNDKSITVETDADLLALASCRTLAGNLIIGSSLSDPIIPDGIVTIRGDLIAVNDVSLLSISAPSLRNIEGTFNLTGLTLLAALNFPVLTSVQTIYWQTLPLLRNLNGWAGVTEADYVTITDTYLESLAGIELTTVARFDINNNGQLKTVDSRLTNITDSLKIEFNAASVSASFPNLTWANNATFRSCGTILLPRLATVNGSIGFFENDITQLDAPQLSRVGIVKGGGDITFANNEALTNVSMPKLTQIDGTLQIVNCSQISAVDGFPKLTTVSGSIDISGEFEEAAFPAIRDVRGGLNVQTTAKFDCQPFDELADDGIVKGESFCQGAVSNPGTEGTGGSATSNGNDDGSSNEDTKNAAGRLSAMNSFAAIPAVALFAALYL